MLSFHRAVEQDFSAVNDLIIHQLHSDVGLVENIGHYIVDSGGKRLRPVLVLLAAKACGYKGAQHIDLAAIIEFIHTATLLHDDVVDTSDMRRGKATANAKFGNAPSVLVGDFLYSRAFQMLVAIGNMDIMGVMANTTNVIAEGEVQQLINAGDPTTSEDSYYEVINKKTAILFASAAEVGAIIAGASEPQKNALKDYGLLLGQAFQLVDDALDYKGNAEELGKNVGDDLAEGKPTLPLIYAMKNGSTEQADMIKTAIEKGGLDKLNDIIEAVQSSGGLDYTLSQAQAKAKQACDCLSVLPESKFTQVLKELAEFSVARTY
ncbi:MAG: octaprenyl diphosphate synthase [Cellvibrionaceae bacterium]